jgi:predicted negative regulator of RcsB-dependent stress response
MAAMSLASAFPIIAIVALNYVQNTSVRLGLMAIFTVAFSFGLTLFSNATKAEAFSASAAFAAVQVWVSATEASSVPTIVQVVFIGGQSTD